MLLVCPAQLVSTRSRNSGPQSLQRNCLREERKPLSLPEFDFRPKSRTAVPGSKETPLHPALALLLSSLLNGIIERSESGKLNVYFFPISCLSSICSPIGYNFTQWNSPPHRVFSLGFVILTNWTLVLRSSSSTQHLGSIQRPKNITFRLRMD
ncbi:hypothetical protein LSTR_LSTR010148 [Laodelphax striatellus]|uniref:Uncharacterized protein n=1 Tax=Laodelphax striatellus TaxID=195883 RepID=A0A482WJR2_LAOST|nr:hypothetical protein LSTR_LSTR010148 [Laodelphax striatellus]